MKVCTKCNIKKEFTEFSKRKTSKDGFRNQCKSCQKELGKEWYKQNKERKKKYREENKERIKEYLKEYREKNKERKKEYQKEWREQNKEYLKEWRKQNKERQKKYNEKSKERAKKWYQKNKERRKEYREKNRERINEWKKEWYQQNKEYQRERRKTDPLFKMKCNLRNRTYQAFKRKGYSKNTKTQEMLGVDWEVCKAHIERQFTKGMSWDNYGEWHIDHIIPLASADTEQRIKELCHYTNLQPLWSEDNLSKSDKINGQQTKIRI